MHEATIIVADTGNNRVSIFTKEGNFLHFLGGKTQKGVYINIIFDIKKEPEQILFF